MVPTPIELEGPKTSAIDVNNSGADDPAARNVAPATSGVSPSTCCVCLLMTAVGSGRNVCVGRNVQGTKQDPSVFCARNTVWPQLCKITVCPLMST